METVLLCSRCGTPNDRQDVTCVRCAELLNRELVQQFDAAEQTAIAEAPAAVGRAGLILAAEAGVDVVEPGQSIAFELRIRNESRIVDNYDLRVEGAAKAWATVTPATVYLLPLGSGAESEATVRVVIQPPRDFTSTAGAHWLYVDADSRASGAFAGRAESTFSILPFKAWTTDVAPALALGRLKAHFNVAVHNEGNDELHLVLDARDEAGRVRARFDHPEVVLEPGVIRVLRLVVRPRFPLPVGPRLTHRLGIEALPAPETPPQTEAEEEASAAVKAKQTLLGGVKGAAAGSSASVGKDGLKFAPPKRPKSPKVPKPPKVKMDLATLAKLRASDDRADLAGRIVVYRQRPFVPLWLVVLLLLALVAAYVYVSRLPDKVVVPDLKGVATSFEADKQLRAAGLTLASPIQQKVEADKTPGEVVGQSPEQKESVDRGSSVTIQVAAGVLNHPTPDLLGATREEADRTLRKAKLTLGPVQPVDAPAKWVVARQIPVKALSVPEGTPVMLFLVKPKPTKAELAAAAAAAAAKAKRDAEKKTPALKLATVPPIGALSAADYAKALTMLKLRPVTKPITASLKKDAVVSVLPAPGSQVIVGKPVTIVASAGIPPLAVQSDGVIRLLNPLGGKRLGLIPADGGGGVEPSWTPDGKKLLYRDGAMLKLVSTTEGAKPKVLYRGGDDLEDATVAPRGTAVAVVRRLEGDGDLCFGTIAKQALIPRCLPDDGWDITGRPAWRPDGRQVVVGARRSSDAQIFTLRAYSTKVPFSTDPDRWTGRTAGDTSVPGKGVLTAQFSPDGKVIAAITNIGSSAFKVVRAAADDLELTNPALLGARACDLAWRPDGGELAIIQVDDGCTQQRGTVFRLAMGKPPETTLVAENGAYPAYPPVPRR